jgi:PAS domain S-box-containing protein
MSENERRLHTRQQKARPTIGFLAADVHDGTSQAIWSGVVDAAQRHDANLICFLGQSVRDPSGFLAQANVLYDLVSAERLDGLLYWTSSVGRYLNRDENLAFLQRYGLPVVSFAPLEGVPSVFVDSYHAMRDEMAHLIEGHGCRRLALIGGPEGHPATQRRYQAYRDTLQEHQIPFDPNLVTPPGMWHHATGVQGIALLLDERGLRPGVDFQAVVAASDILALGALEALQERGVRVPEDVALVGFNDLPEGRVVTPPLTSVAMPFYEEGARGVEALLALLAGEDVPEQILLEAMLVVRQSCGCQSQAVLQAMTGSLESRRRNLNTALKTRRGEILSEMVQATLVPFASLDPRWAEQLLDAFVADLKAEASGGFVVALKEVLRQAAAIGSDMAAWQDVLSALRRSLLPYLEGNTLARAEGLWQQARVVIGEAIQRAYTRQALQAEQQAQTLREFVQSLITTFDLQGLMDVLADGLPKMGIPSAYLSFYENPDEPAGWSRLVLAYGDEGPVGLEAGGVRFPSSQLVPEGMMPQRRYSYMLEPLYFQERQIGFILFEVGPQEGMVYEVLQGEISPTLQGALLVQQVEHRALQFQTAAEVSRAASSILDPAELTQQAVDLIRERFDLYYAGLFLVDRTGEWSGEPNRWAVLRAGTGEAGRQMLERGHKLEIGGASMIGWCVANKRARIALDVGAEAVRFENPLLPETRSELALPLVSRGEVLGALTIQSAQEAAFSQEDIAALQTMADQLANAIANARLYDALAREQYLMKALMDNVPDYIYFKDTESRFIRTTRAHAKTFGLSDPAEAIGKTDFDFFLEEHARQAYEDEQRIIRTGEPLLNVEERETWPDRPDTWASTSKMPLRDEEGRIVGTFGISRDITERRRVEEALQEGEERLETIVNSVQTAIVVIDDETHVIVDANPVAVEMIGMPKEQIVGHVCHQFICPAEQGKCPITDLGQKVDRSERVLLNASGERVPILKSVVPTMLGGRRHLLESFFNITERKAAEAERERLLADLERRALQLQTAAEVSRATSSILNVDELLPQVVELARERFGLYYVGMFLVDESGQWAVLRAGTGEAGRQMLEQGHKLEIGGASMIGWCIANKQARIALDVGEEAVRFENPFLPETRSELALPLVSRGEATGALTIQSAQEAAFSQEDIAVLQTMAGQVANAIENARLLERTQAALREMESIQRRYLQQAWSEYVRARRVSGYQQIEAQFMPLGRELSPEVQQALTERRPVVWSGDGNADSSVLVVPIILRGQPIGAIGFRAEGEKRVWSAEEIALVETISEQLALAAENLRLIDETQRRAARERLTREITDKMRRETNVEGIVQMAVDELFNTLRTTRTFVHLSTAPSERDDGNTGA